MSHAHACVLCLDLRVCECIFYACVCSRVCVCGHFILVLVVILCMCREGLKMCVCSRVWVCMLYTCKIVFVWFEIYFCVYVLEKAQG